MEEIFDLVVVGSGPGGSRAAIQAAKLGKSVALVEKDKMGGACVHTGTIPSKSLREAALFARTASDFSSALRRMKSVVSEEAAVVKSQLERNGVKIFFGSAQFIHPQEIRIGPGSRKIRGKSFILATGSRPIRHQEFPFGTKGVYESDSILSLKKLPPNLLVLGAGVIGCEYASIYARLGSKVTLADRRKELLRSVDPEVIEALKQEFQQSGVKLFFGVDIRVLGKAKGSTNIEVIIEGRKKIFSAILICMGRQPNTEGLSLEKAQVNCDDRGYVLVDPISFQTSSPHVYAVGDMIGPPGLAASSAEQGRIAACKIFEEPCHSFPTSFPYGIYTIPEVSTVGLQENELREKGRPYVVGRATFRELARGLIVGDKTGFIKILVDPLSRKILGVHAIGMGASELIHIGQAVLALEAPVNFLVDNVFNYPTFAEAYKVAALHAMNQINA